MESAGAWHLRWQPLMDSGETDVMKKLAAISALFLLLVGAAGPGLARPLNECATVMSGERPAINETGADAQGRCPEGFVLYRTARSAPACYRIAMLGSHDMPPRMDGSCNRDTQLTSGGWCRMPGIPLKCSPGKQ